MYLFCNISIYRKKVRKYIEKSYGISKKNFNYLKKIEKYYSALVWLIYVTHNSQELCIFKFVQQDFANESFLLICSNNFFLIIYFYTKRYIFLLLKYFSFKLTLKV